MIIRTQTLLTKANVQSMKHSEQLKKTMEKLSTGKRINRASDDSAVLQVSTRFTSKVNALSKVNESIKQTISMLKLADSGVNSIVDQLQRIRELTVQAQNTTLSLLDKQSLQKEANLILENIQHTATTLNYNTHSLLNRGGSVKIGDTMTPNMISLGTTSFVPSGPYQPRTIDIELRVDDYKLDTAYNMARIMGTGVGYISINAESGRVHIRDSESNKSTGFAIPLGERVRLTITYDGTKGELFVNGEKESTFPLSSMNMTGAIELGDTPLQASRREAIVGEIYEFHYYEKVLTDDEIKQNFDGNTVTGAEGSWNFKEENGRAVYDKSGNGNHGVLIGDTGLTGGSMTLHAGENAEDRMSIELPGVTLDDLHLNSLDVTDAKALKKIDHTIERSLSERNRIGSQTNRLEFHVQTIGERQTKHKESLMKIEEADIANETSQLLKGQVQQQTSQNILIKSKQYYQNVLQLIQG